MDNSKWSLLTVPTIYAKFLIAQFENETKDFPCEDFLDQ